MAIDVRAISFMKGSTLSRLDRLRLGTYSQMTYPQGAGAVSAVAVATAGAGYTAIPTATATGSTVGGAARGSGATFTANMKLVGANLTAGGTGYAVNDTINVAGGTQSTTAVIKVLTVTSGVIQTFSVQTAGVFTALPASNALTQASTSGAGTGATFTGVFGVNAITVTAGGSGYLTGTTVALSGGAPTTAATVGAITLTAAAGANSMVDVIGKDLPAGYTILPGDIGQAGIFFVTNRAKTGFTINIQPASATATLAAGAADFVIMA